LIALCKNRYSEAYYLLQKDWKLLYKNDDYNWNESPWFSYPERMSSDKDFIRFIEVKDLPIEAKIKLIELL
jgi:hypothetical protein